MQLAHPVSGWKRRGGVRRKVSRGDLRSTHALQARYQTVTPGRRCSYRARVKSRVQWERCQSAVGEALTPEDLARQVDQRMSTAPLRMRSGLLTKSLRQRSRSGDANLDAELLSSKEGKAGSEPTGICKQLKREEPSSRAEKECYSGSAECMQEIKQILAQRETTRCLTFGCSPPSRSDNPLPANFSRCTPKPLSEACVGFRTDSCISPPAHA